MTMLQQYNHLDQKGQDLISLFNGPPSTRTACPICRENGKDSDGSHLSIGSERIHCFSNQDHGKTLFLEIKRAGRGFELPPRKPAPPSKPTKKKAKFVKRLPRGTHYEYHDQDGKVCFVAVRQDKPKRFWQYTVVDGGYEVRGYEGPRPLYRLNDIKPDGPVIVVEGEKCVDSLIDAGYKGNASTFSQGANSWMKTDYSPLAGREIWLIADADESGRKCMKGLAGHLQGLRSTVKIMLPDGDDGADVADWLDKGHDLETVMDTIAAGLVDYKPSDPFEALRIEIELAEDDEPLLEGLYRDAKIGYFAAMKVNFRYGWLIGRVLNKLLVGHSHGDLKKIYEDYGIDYNLAYRCRKAAGVPWEKASSFASMNQCIEHLRGNNPNRRKSSKSEVHVAALEKEVEDLKESIVQSQTTPQDDVWQVKVTRLEREKRVLISKLSKSEQANRDLERKNAELQAQLDAVQEDDDEIRTIVKNNSTDLKNPPGDRQICSPTDLNVTPDDTQICSPTDLNDRTPGLDPDDYTGTPEIGAWEKLE